MIYDRTAIHVIVCLFLIIIVLLQSGKSAIIGDEATHECMVIEPGDDISDVVAGVQKHVLAVKQIVVTHAHIDHVGGAMKLKAATGAPILLNHNDAALLAILP